MKENSIKTLADFAEYLGENYGCGVNKSRLEYTEIPEIAAAHGWVLNHNSIDDDLCIDLTAREVLIATNNQPSPVQYIVSDFDDFGEENPFEKYRIVASTDPYHAGLKYHRGEVLESSNGTPTEWVHDDNGGFGYTLDEALDALEDIATEHGNRTAAENDYHEGDDTLRVDVMFYSAEKFIPKKIFGRR